ncbi:HNH endonuclease [Escherichia coli]|nr:HNH endonuclease [Escherichia coli]
MNFNTRSVPKEYELLSEFVYVGDDGYLYWDLSVMDSPHRKNKNERLGINTKYGYPKVEFNRKGITLHTFNFWLHHGYLPEIVDHKNTNTLDYRESNLRPANKNSNNLNTPKYNLCITKRPKKDGSIAYRVRGSYDGIQRVVGTYEDEAIANYVAWKMREIYSPGFCPMPPILQRILETGSRNENT